MTNEEQEQGYSPKEFRTPDGAPADVAIFTLRTEKKPSAHKSLPKMELCVLLIRRNVWPYRDHWALPGGFSKETETIYDTARRELREETGVEDVHFEYLDVYSAPGRDPRGWIISHAFYALVNESLLANKRADTDAAEVGLFPVDELDSMQLAFDHKVIVGDALKKIQEKMLRTILAKQFLPEEFTLGQLYQVIRTVVPTFEEDNFTRKLQSTQRRQGILEKALDPSGNPKVSDEYSQRAAQLYRFSGYEPQLSIYT